MKHSKWLLHLVIILLAVNILFFVIWYAFDLQGYVKTKLESYLSELIQGSLKIDRLSINERHLTINGIKVSAGNSIVTGTIRQIQVDYNLFRLLTSGINFRKIIRQINVYNPDLSVSYTIKPPSGKKPTKIPDLTPYFELLNINQGKLSLNLTVHPGITKEDTLVVKERFRNLNLDVNNKQLSEIKLSAVTANRGSIKAEARLDKGMISLIDIALEGYKPYKISYSELINPQTEISTLFKYSKLSSEANPEYRISTIIWNTAAQFSDYSVQIPLIQVEGNERALSFAVSESKINDNRIKLSGVLTDLLNKPQINGFAEIVRFDLSEITPELSGIVTGNIAFNGPFSSVTAQSTIKSDFMEISKEQFKDIEIIANYKEKNFQFVTNTILWRNQLIDIDGNFNLDDLQIKAVMQIHPELYDDNINLNSKLIAELNLKNGLSFNLDVETLDFYNNITSLLGFSGNAKLDLTKQVHSYPFLEFSLENNSDMEIIGVGNLAQSEFALSLLLNDFILEDHVKYAEYNNIRSIISGEVNATLKDSELSGTTDLFIAVTSPKSYQGNLVTDFSYNIPDSWGNLSLSTKDAFAENQPFYINADLSLSKDSLNIHRFQLDDVCSIEADLNLSELFSSSAQIEINSLNIAKYWNMFSPFKQPAPFVSTITSKLDYNNDQHEVSGYLSLRKGQLAGLSPFDADLNFYGNPSDLIIDTQIRVSETDSLNLRSLIDINKDLKIITNCQFNDFSIESVFPLEQLKGKVNGSALWSIVLAKEQKLKHELSCDLYSREIKYSDISFDNISVKARQSGDLVTIDTLLVNAVNELNVSGKGSLGYDLFSNRFVANDRSLMLSISGDILRLLKTNIPYIKSARGWLDCQLNLKSEDEGIFIEDGKLSVQNGIMQLQDQVEPVRDIDLDFVINDNQLKINKFSSQIGNGRLYIRNAIDQGDDNFFIGPLNLGYFLLRTNDAGIQVSIPDYLPSNTVATAVLKGQQIREATIKGPFDDMEISGEIIVSNGSVVYPPNTKNLLQMINLFQKKEELKEQLPLPFTLDLMIKTANNVHYVTYPAFLTTSPNSYLRLVYDGAEWFAWDADFISEKGTLDFYGTVFDVNRVRLEINQTNNIINVNGTFTQKAPDGTLITLSVITNPSKGPDITSQLEFKLTSDNPLDKTTTQILSRLRYNKSMDELTADQKQSLLQDEAMQLISTSVSTTYVSQFLSPIENRIRRFLKLDSFSITTGFVQNLFVEFANDEQQESSFANSANLNSDILQFSSSVFLNNLSISMGKYISSKLFLDYEIMLQESTDLSNQTQLEIYHNASMRFNLPWNLRFIYTFSLKPEPEVNSHEIMLQRSFRF